ncbi:hypothetical protein HELRODRAFT_175289 [Helobdella robusta]|uniref:Uncharacterized protein n=1 Tax=Helobdella robusta TaxID=6412 RepID=T1F942_HELRO|nr:hypothetical protein HELRODRAFT_175289 [Helobdella robusta]ESO00806.1 hypothetical protein HELRODRAFT_175289 [Helobdella robusta]
MPSFAADVEYSSLKNIIVPRICKLCINQTSLSIKVNCLVCLGKLLEFLDKWFVLDEDMLSRVETEHRMKLEQLNSVQQEQKTLRRFAQEAVQIGNGVADNTNKMADDVRVPFNPFDDPLTSSSASSSSSSAAMKMNNNNSTSNFGAKKAQSLTMEEKEKLAKQQEQLQRFQTTNTPLQPSSSSSSATKNVNHNKTMTSSSMMTTTKKEGPKDLTSTLINNNLSMLKLSATTTTIMTSLSSSSSSSYNSNINFATKFQHGETSSTIFPNNCNVNDVIETD